MGNSRDGFGFKRRAMAGISFLALTAAGGVATSAPAAAQTTTWTGPSPSADWFNGANWNAGVPGPWTALNTYPYDAIINAGDGNAAEINSAGAQAGKLIIGQSGTGRLYIGPGGTLTVPGYAGSGVLTLLLGEQANSKGTLVVSGAGANLSASGIVVGNLGTARLDLSAGALADTSLAYVGNAGSGTAYVNAATWNTGQLFVGNDGTGQLWIQNGGKVTTSSNLGVTVGNYANSVGTITVDGAGSELNDQGSVTSMTLGYAGTGHLVVSDKGTVTSVGACMGCGSGGVGTALVTGAGSQWQLTGLGNNYVVGGSGTGTLTVEDGGLFKADSGNAAVTFGSEATGRGTLHLTTGGQAKFKTLNVGGWSASASGSIGEVLVESGGQLSSTGGNVGGAAGALGKVTVTGTGSRWDHAGSLTLGYQGRGEMTVSANGQVTSQDATIASNSGSTGAATVTGAGSKWTNTQHLMVGNRGVGSLFVQNGGEVGTGSLNVGPGGQGSVEISGGGKLTTGMAMIGTNATGGGAMVPTTGDVLVTGAGSSLIASTYIWAGSQGAQGSLTITDNATVSLNNGVFNQATYAGILFLGDNSVAGSAGTLNIGGAVAAAAPGTLTAAGVSFNTLSDTLNFNHTSNNYTFAPSLLGLGTVDVRAGTTHLTGDSSLLGGFIGQVNVLGGKLYVDNKLGGGTDGAGPVAVASGALLGGTGTIAGTVTVADGGILEGRSGQVLTMGSLVLNPNSNVNVALAAPSTMALFNVTGAFTLDGKLNATDAGGLSDGKYRLANYGGMLTNNGLTVTSVPAGLNPGDWSIDTATAGQVNLVIPSAGANAQYWDGPNMTPGSVANGRSGTGVWNATNTNWTNQAGTINAPWAGQTAMFAARSGSAATITIDGAQAITGMTFLPSATDPGYFYTAYRFNAGAGGKLTIANAATPFDVGGTTGVARADNIIAAPIEGSGGIHKLGDGILTLRAANSYSGGTAVDAGILVADYEATALGTGPVSVGANATLLFGAGPTGHLAISNAGQLFFDTVHSAVNRYGGDATITNQATGRLVISNLTDARDLAIINNGGLVEGGLIVSPGNSFVEAVGRRGSIPSVGSISGSGTLRGSFNVGYLNQNDIFSGVMQDIPYGTEADGVTPSTQSRLIKSGTGTLTLTGVNTYTGGTEINGGRLLIDGSVLGNVQTAASGTLGGKGSIAGDVTIDNNGTLEGRSGQVLTMGSLALKPTSQINVALGTPGNTTGLFKVNGNLVLGGTLNATDAGGFGMGVYRIIDYTGALTDNGLTVGTLPSGSGAVQTAVAHQVNLVVSGGGSGGATEFWNGTHTSADGTIHGGSGTWIAGPTNWTNTNGTTAAAWGGQFAIFQNNPGIVTVDNSAGAISTTGMQFIGSGWRVTGNPIALNGADGSTSIRVGDGTAAGASASATIASQLTGNGQLVKTDLGELILTGANSYTGGTTINAGSLQIGDGVGGTTGSILGNVTNNSLLRFGRSDATTFAGTISGSGMVQVVTGNVTLTADNTYTGGTSVLNGASLSIGNGGTAGSIGAPGYIFVGGSLIFNRSDDLTIGGTMVGTGSLRQIGMGKTELTGNFSGFTGATTVENGALAVNGQLGGTLDVFASGRLQGVGTVGNTVVSGVIAPGNSIGTLNVGNITFNASSIYEVEVNAGGQTDLIQASGTATITGGTVRVLADGGNYAPATTYKILTAQGGLTANSAFSGVTSNLAFLDPSLSYDANDVWLTMTRNTVIFRNVGITPNQIAAGGGVESLGLGNPVYNAVLNLSAPQARYAFDQLSGEIHASARTAMMEDSRFVRSAVNDRLRAAFGGVGATAMPVMAYAEGGPQYVPATTERFVAWGQAFGSWGHWNSDGNAARLNRSTGGFFVGGDAPLFDTWRFGAVAGYSRTNFNARDRASSGSSNNYHLGLYGGTAWGNLALRTGAAYTWHDITTNRSVIVPGIGDSLNGQYDAATAQVFGELAYGIDMRAARLEPFANFAYVNLHTDDLREHGRAAALASPSANIDATFTTLGLRASTSFNLGGSAVTAKGTLGWRHAFGDVTPTTAMRFVGGGDAFSIVGVPIVRNAAVVEAGLDFNLSPNAVLGVSYGGQFGSGVTDQTFRANFNVKF